jgi:cytochrome c oxidase subunit 3
MPSPNSSLAIEGGGFDHTPAPDYAGRLRRARLGLIVGLAPIVMLFVSLTSAFIVRRGLPTFDERTGIYVRDWRTVNLPLTLLAANTLILAVSSLTIELARRQTARRAVLIGIRSVPGVSIGEETTSPWLVLTVLLGLGFLVGQCLAWGNLARQGFYLAGNPSSSFVYLLTAAHAVHLAGGLAALLYALVASLLGRPADSRYIVVDVAAWYWHFMAVLWIYVFAFLEFAR